MLKQRIITGLILVCIIFGSILWLPSQGFAALALLIIVGLGSWEWANLTGCNAKQQRVLGALALTAVAAPLLFVPVPLTLILWVSVPVWLGILVALVTYARHVGLYKHHAKFMRILGIFILIPAWFALFRLHLMDARYVLYLIGLIALADTAAYFTGRALGKTKLAPALSPGKTREGFYGALAATSLWAVFGSWWLALPAGISISFVVLSMFVVCMSVAGDLFESLLKREAGVKDSGSLLPGHGGILDRVDSMLAAAPIFTLGLFWIL